MANATKKLNIGEVTLHKGTKVSERGNVTVFHNREVKVVDGQAVTVQMTVWASETAAKALGLSPAK